MTPHEFIHYLNGVKDGIPEGQPPNATQWSAVRRGLSTVFTKVTPNRPPERVYLSGFYLTATGTSPRMTMENGVPQICNYLTT